MKWKPSSRSGVLFGSGLMLAGLLIDVGLLWRVITGPINGITFVCAFLVLLSLPAMAVIGYRIYDLSQLRYEFDRNRLVISTAASEQIIPMDSIERLIVDQDDELEVRMSGIRWPGSCTGHGEIEGIGLTLFYAVNPPREQATIVTPTLAYGITPPDVDTFVRVFNACKQMGTSVQVKQESLRSSFVHWPIWSDRLAQGVLLGGVLLSSALFAILCFRFPHLPNLLSMHYDAAGQVDRIASRDEVFALPIIGLITLLTNGTLGIVFYRRERMISYLAWSGSLIVQVFFLLALWNIVA